MMRWPCLPKKNLVNLKSEHPSSVRKKKWIPRRILSNSPRVAILDVFMKQNLIVSVLVVLTAVFGFLYFKNFSYNQLKAEYQAKEYNAMKNDLDYYMCLDNARVFYEDLWQEHCKDRGQVGYCDLPLDLNNNMRWS